MTTGVWTEPAVADLDSIRSYIAHDSEVYADTQIQAIFEAVDSPESFPESGRTVPEIGQSSTRELVVGSFRVIYAGDTARILAVLHAAGQFKDPR